MIRRRGRWRAGSLSTFQNAGGCLFANRTAAVGLAVASRYLLGFRTDLALPGCRSGAGLRTQRALAAWRR
jgi:hypothetical protein